MYFLFLFVMIFTEVWADSSVARPFSYSYHEQLDLVNTCPNQRGSLEAKLREDLYSVCTLEHSSQPLQYFQSSTGRGILVPPSFDSKSQCLNTSQSSETYCIYTSSTFAQNCGLSILATPSSTSTILNSTGFKTPPELYPIPKSNHLFYETVPPDRGKGLRANHTFRHGI
jgi:hypothetical protein